MTASRRPATVSARPDPAAGSPVHRGRRRVGIAGILGAGDRAVAPARRLRRRAVPDQPQVRRPSGVARACPSIGELPPGVDLVVFVVPARVVVGMIDDCGARGVRGIMVVSSGFAEAGEEGRALQDEFREAAAAHPHPGARSERRRLRELRRPGRALRHDAAAASASRHDQRHQPERHGGLGDEPDGVGSGVSACASSSASATRPCWGSGTCSSGRRPTRRRRSSRATSRRCATSRASAAGSMRCARAGKPVLICAPEGRSEAARRSIVAHTGALAGNTDAARRLAPRAGRGAGR